MPHFLKQQRHTARAAVIFTLSRIAACIYRRISARARSRRIRRRSRADAECTTADRFDRVRREKTPRPTPAVRVYGSVGRYDDAFRLNGTRLETFPYIPRVKDARDTSRGPRCAVGKKENDVPENGKNVASNTLRPSENAGFLTGERTSSSLVERSFSLGGAAKSILF